MNNNSNGNGDININRNNAVNNMQSLTTSTFIGATTPATTPTTSATTPAPTPAADTHRTFQRGDHVDTNRADRAAELLLNRNTNRQNHLQTMRITTIGRELPFSTDISDDLLDVRQYNQIIGVVQSSQPSIPSEIRCVLAEFALGKFFNCVRDQCDYDVSILYKTNDDVFFYNPSTKLLPPGHIDINDKIVVYCKQCVEQQPIQQCNFSIDKPRHFNCNDINDIIYERIFCSNRFIAAPGVDKCNQCLIGRDKMIDNKSVRFTGRYGGCQYRVIKGNSTITHNFGTFTDMNVINAYNNNNQPNGCTLM